MTATNDIRPLIDHAIGSRGRLTVRLAAAEIRLAAVDGDRVVVRMPAGSNLPDRVVVEPDEGGLTIREKDGIGPFSIGRGIAQLEIDVPAAAEVSIDVASGWLDAQGLRGEQRYRLVSAETRLRAVAGHIELNTVSGDATIELADAADLAIKSVSGDVAVHGGRLDSLRIGTTSGDIRIDSPLAGRTGNAVETLSGDVSVVAASGMRVDAKTVSGDLLSDLPHRSDGRMGRRTMVIGDGSVELGFRSVSGDLRIRDTAARPTPPLPPTPPAPPHPPIAPVTPPATADTTDPAEADRLAILRSLERGELDVPTAMDRLAALDAEPRGPGREPTDG